MFFKRKKEDKLNWNEGNIKESEQLIDKLQLENLNLKNEVGYYKRYIEYLKDNYIFILKSLDCAKDIYDTIGENDEEFN